MSANEFQRWLEIFNAAPVDEDGDSPIADLAWRAMEAVVHGMEDEENTQYYAAKEIGDEITWATFWIAAAAVICVFTIWG